MSLKAKVESVLFMSDKPLKAQAVATILGEDLQNVRQALLELIHDYENRAGGLEIADEDGYSFRVKEEFANLMNQFLPVEITAAELRTLSAIAIKQPIPQSEIIRVRGAGAYEHIRELVIKDLVSRKDDGRSPMLSTTKRFQEYFRLSKDGKSLRQYLKRQMKKKEKEENEQTEQLDLFTGDPSGLGLDPVAAAAFSPDNTPVLPTQPPADIAFSAEASAEAASGAVSDLKALISNLPAEVDVAALVAAAEERVEQSFAPPETTEIDIAQPKATELLTEDTITPPDLSELNQSDVAESGAAASLNETTI